MRKKRYTCAVVILAALLGTCPVFPAMAGPASTDEELEQGVRDYIDRPVMIPNRGGSCESLNASVATAILCSEFLRRRE